MLSESVIKGDLNSVKTLLDSGYDGSDHGLCICLAAINGHGEIVQLLLKHGFDVNQEDIQGHTPIYYSVGRNDVKTTEILLQNGAEPNGKSKLLFLASRKGFEKMVKVLVGFGAEVNAKDEYGQTPLHHAIVKDSAVFTFLRESVGKNIRAMEKVLHVLLSNGADVNAKTENGFSPLHFALLFKYSNIVNILLEHGADFHSLVDREVITPKLSRFRRRSNQSVTLGRLKMEPRLTSVLHIAAESNDIQSLKMLLTAGAAVDCVSQGGTTPLVVAIITRHVTIARALLDAGADIEQRNKHGLTPLHMVCRYCSENILNSLLRAGANLNATCSKGKVPYEYMLQLVADMRSACWGGFPSHYCNLYRESLRMMKILHNYLFVMYVNGFYVHDNQKEVAMKTPKTFDGVCKKEIEEFAKHVSICKNLNLWRIIKETRKPFYVRGPGVLKGLDQAMVAANAKYPGLGYFAKFLVRSAQVRVSLINMGVESFVNFNRQIDQLPLLPLHTIENVLSFLLNEEIQTFVNCAESLWR